MGMFVSREEALEAIGEERLAALEACVAEAWRKYDEVIRPVIPTPSPVGLANIVHELVIEEARLRFANDDSVNLLDGVSGRFLAELDKRLVVQFRKLTEEFQTRNNPTDTSRAFDEQQPELPGIPDSPRLTVGYQLGQYNTSIAGLFLAFIIGRSCEWYYDLKTGESSQTFDFPVSDGPSAAEQEAREEERRKAEDEEKDAEGEGA